MTGQVCWVGRSSMDVLCSVENENGEPLVQSHFIMVARCPKTGRAAPVVQLKPETETEIANYKHSEELNAVSIHLTLTILKTSLASISRKIVNSTRKT